jgi:hypothetical protein
MGLYGAFAFIIVRQEQLMSRVFEGASESFVRMATYIHLVISVGIFVIAIFLL